MHDARKLVAPVDYRDSEIHSLQQQREVARRLIYLLQWGGARFHKAIRAIQADCPPEIAKRIGKALADNATPPEGEWIDAADLRAALTTAQSEAAELRKEVERLREERDGARKALDYFMGDPAIPAGVLDRVRFQMQRYKETQHEE